MKKKISLLKLSEKEAKEVKAGLAAADCEECTGGGEGCPCCFPLTCHDCNEFWHPAA